MDSRPAPDLTPLWASLREQLAGGGTDVVRAEIDVPDVDPMAWLAARTDKVRLYCSDREDVLSIAAVGRTDWLKGKVGPQTPDPVAMVQAKLDKLPAGIRSYGGMRFDPDRRADWLWRQIGGYMFVLPEMELIREGDRCRLAVNLRADGDAKSRLAALATSLTPWAKTPEATPLPASRWRWNSPGRWRWRRAVRKGIEAIRSGALTKIVLARRSVYTFSRPLSSLGLLAQMIDVNRRCYHFGFCYGSDLAFLGLTPERLFRREGERVLSESVAGTLPRGQTPEEDQAFAGALMTSDKLRMEQRVVTDHIRAALSGICAEITGEKGPEVLPLDRIQHLITRFEARLEPSRTTSDVIRALHPTPAVGGAPRAAAMALLRRLEGIDRGWYSGPIGWLSRDAAEFAVAIRCGVVAGRRLVVYAGAGMVEGSVADDEWDEIESKMQQFLHRISGS
jgi:menaquinone-specific isochorismate synthase